MKLNERQLNPFTDEPASILHKRKSKKRRPLSVADNIAIAHKVIVEKELLSIVAKEYCIASSTVSGIVKSVESNDITFQNKVAKRDKVQDNIDAITRVIQYMTSNNMVIDSSK